jgi:hypothetical protein
VWDWIICFLNFVEILSYLNNLRHINVWCLTCHASTLELHKLFPKRLETTNTKKHCTPTSYLVMSSTRHSGEHHTSQITHTNSWHYTLISTGRIILLLLTNWYFATKIIGVLRRPSTYTHDGASTVECRGRPLSTPAHQGISLRYRCGEIIRWSLQKYFWKMFCYHFRRVLLDDFLRSSLHCGHRY